MNTHAPLHLLNFVRKFVVNSVFFLIPLHFLRLNYSGLQIGLIMAAYASSPLLFSFPIGWLNDRLTIKRVIQAGLILLIVGLFAVNWTQHYLIMAVVFLLLGGANNALDVSTNSFFYKDQAVMDQNKKYGLVSFWLALGIASGTLAGGFLTYYTSFRVMFQFYVVLLLLLLLFLRVASGEMPGRIMMREYRRSLFNRKTVLFAIMILVLTLHWGAEGTIYSPFLKAQFGLNNLQLSLYIALPILMMASAAFAFHFTRHDQRKNKRIFLAAMAVSGIGLIFMVQNNIYLSFASRVVHEIGDGLLGSAIGVYVSRLFDRRSIGGSTGFLTMFMTMGHMAGSMLFSTIGYGMGFQAAFILAGALLLANALFGIYVFRTEEY